MFSMKGGSVCLSAGVGFGWRVLFEWSVECSV